jgi:hypothetical protein
VTESVYGGYPSLIVPGTTILPTGVVAIADGGYPGVGLLRVLRIAPAKAKLADAHKTVVQPHSKTWRARCLSNVA